MGKAKAKKKAVEVKAPPVDVAEMKEPAPADEPVNETPAESGVKSGPEITLPENHTIIYGGPVINGVRCPFGFSVPTASDPVKGHEAEYGVGNGVEKHSEGNGATAYKIIFCA